MLVSFQSSTTLHQALKEKTAKYKTRYLILRTQTFRRGQTRSTEQLTLRHDLLLRWRGGQGAGGGQPAWAGSPGGFRLHLLWPSSLIRILPQVLQGLSSQSLSCVTRSTPLACCQPALKRLSEGTQGASCCP